MWRLLQHDSSFCHHQHLRFKIISSQAKELEVSLLDMTYGFISFSSWTAFYMSYFRLTCRNVPTKQVVRCLRFHNASRRSTWKMWCVVRRFSALLDLGLVCRNRTHIHIFLSLEEWLYYLFALHRDEFFNRSESMDVTNSLLQ